LLRLSITSVKPLRAGMVLMRHSPCLSQATSPGGGHTNMSVCSSSTTRDIDLHSKHSQRSRRPKNVRDSRQADCHTLKSLPLPLCCLRQKRSGYKNQRFLLPVWECRVFTLIPHSLPDTSPRFPSQKTTRRMFFMKGHKSLAVSVPLREPEASTSNSFERCKPQYPCFLLHSIPKDDASQKTEAPAFASRPPNVHAATTTTWQGCDFW
jgi:hypothetical protein